MDTNSTDVREADKETIESLCLVCSATFAEGTEHECPREVRRRWEAQMWARYIQRTYQNSGKGWGKTAALKLARQTLPNITPAQVAAIGTGEIEWSEVYGWFGLEAEETDGAA